MTTEAEPVATCRKTADVADRMTTHTLGQLEDLGYGQHRPFRSTFVPRAADPARIAGQDLVLVDSRHQNRSQQPVRLGRYRDRHAVAQQGCPPLANHPGRDLAERDTAQVRRDVLLEQPSVMVNRARSQPWVLRNPHTGVLKQRDLGPLRIGPNSADDLRLDER